MLAAEAVPATYRTVTENRRVIPNTVRDIRHQLRPRIGSSYSSPRRKSALKESLQCFILRVPYRGAFRKNGNPFREWQKQLTCLHLRLAERATTLYQSVKRIRHKRE